MIHINIRQRSAQAQATEPITAGSVGLEVRFRFSEDWAELDKIAVFRGSGQTVDVLLTDSVCAVPHEVLQSEGGSLHIGVYGTGNQGQRVTPTVWADAGRIRKGAAPSLVPAQPATQSLVQQILELAREARTIAQSVRDDANAGAFDGEDGAVTSVNGRTGAVVLDASDLGAYVKPSGGIPGTDLAETYLTRHQSLAAYRTAAAQDAIDQQIAAAIPDVSGKADKVTELTVSDAGAVTRALDAGKAYHFTGALTALTLTLNAPAGGQRAQYHFDFATGSTAPTVTIPGAVTMPDDQTFAANKRYEIDILDGYGVVSEWTNS